MTSKNIKATPIIMSIVVFINLSAVNWTRTETAQHYQIHITKDNKQVTYETNTNKRFI